MGASMHGPPSPCRYCGQPLRTMRAKVCRESECRRLYNNERMRDLVKRRRSQGLEPFGKKPKTCQDCGAGFSSRHPEVRFCSSCAHRRSSAEAIQARAAAARARRGDPRPVPTFGPPSPFRGQSSPLPARHPARQDWTRSTGLIFVSGRCLRCGSLFTIGTGSGQARYCSRVCARAEVKARRRAKTPGDISPARRWAIFERDNWRCQLCGKLIQERYRQDPFHRWGPTIDHILPVDLGGKHYEWNLQAAHRQCNSEKSNRVAPGGDQLRLAV